MPAMFERFESECTARTPSDPEASAQRELFMSRAMAALEARDLGPALELAEDAKKGEKDVLLGHLGALAAAFGAIARSTVADQDADQYRTAGAAAARHALAIAAIEDIEANASTQLAVEAMLLKMRARSP